MGRCLASGAEFDPSAAVCPGCGAPLEPTEIRAPADDGGVYLFSSFRDEDGGLVLAHSADLLEWHELPGSRLNPSVGDGIMRDPFVARGPDGTYHVVWTSGWERPDIGYARSTDLREWSEPRLLPLMESEPATVNCWAPKLFYDGAAGRWQIVWSSWVRDEARFGTANPPETDKNHRIWTVTTEDFETFGEPEVLFDPGYSCIDGYLQRGDGEWLLFFKDERHNSAAEPSPDHQNVRLARADDRYGPFGEISDPITGDGPQEYYNEGPCTIRVDDRYYLFYDLQHVEDVVGVTVSPDLVHWADVSGEIDAPAGFKHGHVLRVPITDLEGAGGTAGQ